MSEAPSSPPERPGRRVAMVGGLLALPAWLAACGGADDGGSPAQALHIEGLTADDRVRYLIPRRPDVALLGRVPLRLAPTDAAAATARWIVVNAGTDARALEVMAGDTRAADRLSLTTGSVQGAAIRLQSDRPVLSLHVACANQAGYALTGGAELGGAGVCRWDFAERDAIDALELSWTPGVAVGDAGRVEALGG